MLFSLLKLNESYKGLSYHIFYYFKTAVTQSKKAENYKFLLYNQFVRFINLGKLLIVAFTSFGLIDIGGN